MSVKETGPAVEKRVDPRVRRTRELIVRAFNELASEKGHTGLTVQEIAKRATVNRATFYAHFADQYELFDYIISETFREELGRRLTFPPGLNEDNLRALLLAACYYLEWLNTGCRGADRQFRPLIEARVQAELYELLLDWIETVPDGVKVRRTSPEVAASVVSWSIFGAALDRSREGGTRSAEEVADQVLSLLAEGLFDPA